MRINNTRWWAVGISQEDELLASAMAAISNVHGQQSMRAPRLLDYIRLYSGRYVSGFDASYLYQVRSFNLFDDEKLRVNIIQEVIDTIVTRVAKQRPRPMFLTERGNWDEQQAAKDLTDWCDAVLLDLKVHGRLALWYTDAGILGSGIAKVGSKDGRVTVDRVLPHEVMVDVRDGKYGSPRAMYQVHEIDRDVLADMFPGKAKEIDDAPGRVIMDAMWGDGSMGDDTTVQVLECWHLRSGPKAKDGRHFLMTGNAILTPQAQRAWNRDRFPFAKLDWHAPLIGYWGVGAAERLIPEQLEINVLMRRVQEAMRKISKPTVILPKSSGIPTGHITSRVADILETNSGVPIVITPTAVNPEVFSQQDRIRGNAYRKEGLAEGAISGQIPAGLESGKAIRLQNNIETDRLGVLSRQGEQFVLDISQLIIDEARNIIESGEDESSWSMLTNERGKARMVDLADIDLEESSYRIQCYPVSQLSNDPQGRLEDIQSLLSAGMLQPEVAAKLLDFPDLAAEQEIDFAPLDFIDDSIRRMLRSDEPEYEPPQPWQNLQLTQDRTQKALQRAELDGAPEERLDLMRRYLSDVLNMQSIAAQASAPPPQMGPGNGPPALPPGGP